ncbi:hypothetical protein LTR84_010660 [Exophiala bonariae]|uniref:ATP synthase F(0) complex subunit e, mitochondrial n=1 Tax=Exophiala bonariae TaxID=1690606 RepID=A0AAV9MST3_9EURO|nr:hypothetical protein LTR84_010660 [Exophiala bonariae]
MSTSQGVNVLRYSALFAGLFYGFSHQRTISANTAAAHAQAEYQHKIDLIQKAKVEWAKKTMPSSSKTDDVDLNDKNFDLDAYLTKLAAEN